MQTQENPKLHDAAEIAQDVTYIMSMPRLAFTDNMFCLVNAVHKLRLFGQRTGGVFWEQGMENMLEDAIAKGFKYALTIDYDTYYNEYHVADLYRLMEGRPDVDILMPLQTRRGHPYPMVATFEDPQGDLVKVYRNNRFIDGVAEIDTGHFGLTLIRLEALKKLTKPWFVAKTDPAGGWHQGHKDADVNFWIRCKDAGIKVAVGEVYIGHIQSLCSWCGPAEQQYTAHHQYINETLDGALPQWTVPKSLLEARRRTNMAEELKKPETVEAHVTVPDSLPDPEVSAEAASKSGLVLDASIKEVANRKIAEHETNLVKLNQVLEQMQQEANKHGEAIDKLKTQGAEINQQQTAIKGAIAGLKDLVA